MSKTLTCFIIMPFDNRFLPVRDMLRKVVRATKRGHAIRADDIFRPWNVVDQIKEAIQQCDFCIADVTDNNPNVMWEVGYASALQKPVIALRQHTEQLPFDVRQEKFFTYDLRKPSELRAALTKAVKSVVADITSKPQFEGWRYDELTDLRRTLARCRPRRKGKDLLTILTEAVKKCDNSSWQVDDEERLMKAIASTTGKVERTDCFWWLIVYGVFVYGQIDLFQVKGSNAYADNLRLIRLSDRGIALLNLLSEHARSIGRGTAESSGHTKTTEQEFFVKLEARSTQDAEIARRMLQWSLEHFTRIEWRRSSFVPVYEYGAEFTHNPITVYGTSKAPRVGIKFGRMRRRNGFSGKDLIELARRLNQVPGVNLPKSVLDAYPTIPLSTFATAKSLDRFLQTIGRTIEMITARSAEFDRTARSSRVVEK